MYKLRQENIIQPSDLKHDAYLFITVTSLIAQKVLSSIFKIQILKNKQTKLLKDHIFTYLW